MLLRGREDFVSRLQVEAINNVGSDFAMGEDVDGLGGFVLEAPDGSMILDYRFDGLFERSWITALPAVTSALFGEN